MKCKHIVKRQRFQDRRNPLYFGYLFFFSIFTIFIFNHRIAWFEIVRAQIREVAIKIHCKDVEFLELGSQGEVHVSL